MASTLSLSLLLAVVLIPLVAAVVTGIFGTAAGGNLLGHRAVHVITIAGVAISFALSVWVLVLTAQGVRFAPGGIRKGAAGYDITFLHPKSNDEFPIAGEGVLIELVQAPADVIAALG